MNAWSAATSKRSLATALAPLAALPMYDLPELQAANDALWGGIAMRLAADGLEEVPARLTRTTELEALWTSPALLLAQTCGYPLVTTLGAQVQVVATPRYRAPGCEGPFRRSAIVVRAHEPAHRLADLRGARGAVNDMMSDSGMNLFRAAIAPLAGEQPFFRSLVVTGAHLASVEAVAFGEADVAAIDAVTWAHIGDLRPDLAWRLRVLEWTDRTPGLPLITAAASGPRTLAALRRALAEVAADPQLAEAREILRLEGFSLLPRHYYQLTSHMEARAQALGYPFLR